MRNLYTRSRPTQTVFVYPLGCLYMTTILLCECAEALTDEERPWSVSHSPDSQAFTQPVSQLAYPHSAFIINQGITLEHSPNDVGWKGTRHDRICSCLHYAQQVKYQALIWSRNIAYWVLCSYYCQMMVAASGTVLKIANMFLRTKSRQNVSDGVLCK